MLIPPDQAQQFLTAYKQLLATFAGRSLTTADDFTHTRRAFFEKGDHQSVMTSDPDLREALQTARFGDFVVGRHLARHTEMIGPKNWVCRVKGLTTELKSMVPPWALITTAVMQFKGSWICDGLAEKKELHIGPNMRRDFQALINAAKIDAVKATDDKSLDRGAASHDKAAASFTAKQGQYLAFIYYYSKVNGQPPAEADMVRYFGVSAPSVHQMVVTLEKNRFIDRIAGKGRSIRLLLPREQLPDLE